MHATDGLSNQLLVSWLVNVTAEAPTVTQAHEIPLSLGVNMMRRLAYKNEAQVPSDYAFRSSDTSVMEVQTPSVQFQPYETRHIELNFKAQTADQASKKGHVYLFINSTSVAVNDTYMFKLTYQ